MEALSNGLTKYSSPYIKQSKIKQSHLSLKETRQSASPMVLLIPKHSTTTHNRSSPTCPTCLMNPTPLPPQNAWSKPLSIVATSVQKTADNSSAQPSAITTDSQISVLTKMVEQMRNEMTKLRKQQASIEQIIEKTISEKISEIDKRYDYIISKINNRWENAINKQLEKAEKDIHQTVDMVIAKRNEVNKQQRSEPGSVRVSSF